MMKLIQDKATRTLFEQLTGTLRRMEIKQQAVISTARVTYLMRDDDRFRVARFMRRESINYEAEALRRLVAIGLHEQGL